MVGLMPLHGASEIGSRIVFSATCDDCIAENFSTTLPYFFCLFSRSPAFHAAKHIQQFEWLDICNRLFADVREHIFIERFHNVRGISLRPFVKLAGMPFTGNFLKGIPDICLSGYLFFTLRFVRIDTPSDPPFCFITFRPCIRQGNVRIYPQGQQLFFASDTVLKTLISCAVRFNQKIKSSTISEFVGFIFWFSGINLAGNKFHWGYLHKTEQHIPPNVPPHAYRFWGTPVDVRIQTGAGKWRL